MLGAQNKQNSDRVNLRGNNNSWSQRALFIAHGCAESEPGAAVSLKLEVIKAAGRHRVGAAPLLSAIKSFCLWCTSNRAALRARIERRRVRPRALLPWRTAERGCIFEWARAATNKRRKGCFWRGKHSKRATRAKFDGKSSSCSFEGCNFLYIIIFPPLVNNSCSLRPIHQLLCVHIFEAQKLDDEQSHSEQVICEKLAAALRDSAPFEAKVGRWFRQNNS